MLKFASLFLLVQATLISATKVLSTRESAWTNTYTTTYSTEISVENGFLGLFKTTTTIYDVYVPAVQSTIYNSAVYTNAKDSSVVTYSTSQYQTQGANGAFTIYTAYYISTPVRASATTSYSYGTFSGSVAQTAVTTSTATVSNVETIVTLYNVALPTDALKSYTTNEWDGSVTSTSTSAFVATDSYGLKVTSTVFDILTPRPSGVTSYAAYTGNSTVFYSTIVNINFGFKGLLFGAWETTTYLVNTPIRNSIETVTLGTEVATERATVSSVVSTVIGADSQATTVTYYFVAPVHHYATSTSFTQGTQTDATVTFTTDVSVVNGTNGIATTETVYGVAIPTHFQKSTTFDYWPGTFVTTYATDIQTTVGTDGSSTANTVFYVYTPRDEGITSYAAYTGNSTVFYSTIVNINFGFKGLLFGAWETTTYLVNTPIRNSIKTVTLGTEVATERATVSSVVSTVIGADSQATTVTYYFVAPVHHYATSTSFTQGTQTDATVTFTTDVTVVNGTNGVITTETVYGVAIPTTYHQTTSFIEGSASVTTISTEYSTITGTDGKATEETIFHVETPRASGIYSNVPYNGTETSVFSTSVDIEWGFQNLIFGLWSTSYYFVHTPSRVSTEYSTQGYFGNSTSTYSTGVSTITGTDKEATTVTLFLVQTPMHWEKTTVLSQGTQTSGEVTYGTTTNTVTGTDGEQTTITTYSVALPTYHQRSISLVAGNNFIPTVISTQYVTGVGADSSSTETTVYIVATHSDYFAATTTTTWDRDYTTTSHKVEVSWGFVGVLFAPWIIREYVVYVPEDLSSQSYYETESSYETESYIPTSSSVYEDVTESFIGTSSFVASVSGTVSVLSGYVSYQNGTVVN
ncbi:hypothetical protein TPHA_0I00730 [Tetrapisispora phaffii CBS 4417]|uniref:Uncharacterized protein n=1 Tax=Tetrapisispora phaffii (strain ATCC 24235 / CBS 4417 / NBRC 1672 / NRRL Y-8282 / UCD 70-5) TaxID=1071381 RepID=G8BXF1_TETPH|nr:hypothetical protein TPHA_0I00730 [Tetrapisispora phaffii CBS 4417]CCE64579.1 hypothetical protein TPHA_0I00730 [Tetrapisispora phaffii CBS 4417]